MKLGKLVLTRTQVKQAVAASKIAVETGLAYQGTLAYKHKEKVTKGLTVASTVLGVLERAL